jgi:hypothetical protein
MSNEVYKEDDNSVELENLSKLQKRKKPVYTRTPKAYDPFRNINYFKKRKVLPEISSGPLNLMLEKYGLNKKLMNYDFVRNWSEIVGEGIAKYAVPASFKDGLLVVNVTDSSWAQELNFQKNLIKTRLNAFLTTRDNRDNKNIASSINTGTINTGKLETVVKDIFFAVKETRKFSVNKR